MRLGLGWGLLLTALLCGQAGATCRLAFDFGSSGIRVGQSGQAATTEARMDALGLLATGQGAMALTEPTIEAIRRVIAAAPGPGSCDERVGVGFSAWRLAQQQDPIGLRRTLAEVHARTGVPILLVPQSQEGRYGYEAARHALGSRLTTAYVLDIGGGSLQINGPSGAFGAALGQKAWHHMLCEALGRAPMSEPSQACMLQPMTPPELALARRLLQDQLAPLGQTLPAGVAMTAFTRPVTQGVRPAVQRLTGQPTAPSTLTLTGLAPLIDQWAPRPPDEWNAATGLAFPHRLYLLSDMLLVEGILKASRNTRLQVEEPDTALSNVPAILDDVQAYRWARHYRCYLGRLATGGESVYRQDPKTCPAD